MHLFKKYAAKGDDADVKQFAEKTLPTRSSIIWMKRKSCQSGHRRPKRCVNKLPERFSLMATLDDTAAPGCRKIR